MASDSGLTSEQWRAVYRVLVDEAGASDRECEDFMFFAGKGFREYRFQGRLGFGGKVRWDGRRVWVDCYPEDMTDERRAIIERVNRLLAGAGASLPLPGDAP